MLANESWRSYAASSPGTMLCGAMAMAYLFVVFSRVAELRVLVPLHLGAGVAGLAAIAALASGNLGESLTKDTAGRCFLGLTFWMMLSTPFGIWRSGSLNVLLFLWTYTLALWVSLSSSIFTEAQFLRAIKVWAAALVVMCLKTMASGSMVSGRFTGSAGFFSNPNDLATILVMTLPVFWLLARTGGRLQSLLWLAATLPLWYALLRTGSRGGLLGLAAVFAIVFLHAEAPRKVAVLLVAGVLVCGSIFLLPKQIVRRYASLTSDAQAEDDGGDDLYASTSTASRKEMARQALSETFKQPLFGVGPGNFKIRSVELFKARGKVPPWTAAHNTLLQMSSENGIPAAILFLIILVSSFRKVSQARRIAGQEFPKLYHAAGYLRASMVGYCVCASFGNYAYQIHLPILAALALGLRRASLYETGRKRDEPVAGGAAAQPAPRQVTWPQRLPSTTRAIERL
jgi:O-antigen ligase